MKMSPPAKRESATVADPVAATVSAFGHLHSLRTQNGQAYCQRDNQL